MILYFTGTGNSAYIARQIAEQVGDQALSINQYLKSNERGDFNSERPYIFVAPVYSWSLPRIVEKFILESKFNGSKQAYFILNCGSGFGNAVQKIREICQQKGWEFMGFRAIIMPENYVALFTCPEPDQAQAIIDRAQPEIAKISKSIQGGQSLEAQPVKLKFLTSLVNPIFYKLIVKDKHFFCQASCISCGLCVKLCPLNNIRLEGPEKRPRWLGNCTHCMACISACPTQAIQYKKSTIGKTRYYLAEK